MIDCDTVNFIGMLNKLARITKDSIVFIGVTENPSDITSNMKLSCATGFKLYYDALKLIKSDKSYNYYPLIKSFGKENFVYYPRVFVAASKETKSFCLFAFAENDFNWNKAYIITDGIWGNVMDL